ncbi:MAG TPA: protein-L-isoaspartate O-methyltransferase [Allosphingosinicella sp.]|jgi:protein-L-isoaspartate(D-aspartate) O-methyltransferase
MTEHNFEHMRRAMVASTLRTTGVNNPRVLAAIGAVPRERFVPAERVAAAYADTLVPLGNGRELNSPMALGRMLSEVSPQEGERALVVGAATGYAAAVMARLVGSVVATEEDPALIEVARHALSGTGVKLVKTPLALGYEGDAPYDLILIDGAVESVPQPIIDQLVDGGRLATAILDQGVSRVSIGRRVGESFGVAPMTDVATAILPGFSKPRAFSF